MANAPTVDRATAARINPLISPVGHHDTLSNCAQLVRAIGYAVESADESVCAPMHRLASAIAAAVEFELAGGGAL